MGVGAAAPEVEELLPAAPEAEELLPAARGLVLRVPQSGAVYVSVLTCARPLHFPGCSAGIPCCHSQLPRVWQGPLQHLLLLLLQANVVCVVYDVTKEATIDKVMGPHCGPAPAAGPEGVPSAGVSVLPCGMGTY